MKQTLFPFLIAASLSLAASAASAECYADYKAKQDSPLRLHYGVVRLNGACDGAAAQAELNGRLRAGGWTLLNVVSVFGPEGLAQRKASAGQFYLRF